ncbi:MAG: PAS domain S-box protein, partial [Chitinophagaceae bacterium]
INNQEKTFARLAFDEQVSTLRETINTRMHNHEYILLGAAGLFAASETVSRDEFFKYIARLDLAGTYPGIQAVAFAKWLSHDELAQETKKIQQEGFSEFSIHPEGIRDQYAAIIYIEPFSKRNLQAFGFDMFSEATRQQAMRHAVEKDVASMTARVKLVQEGQQNIQPGVLMYLPIYKKNLPLTSPRLRWQGLDGFVYSPFRMGDLMNGILSNRNVDLDFIIYDGAELSDETLLYTSAKMPTDKPPLYVQQFQIPLYGQIWTVVATSNKNFEVKSDGPLDTITLVFGSVFSVIVCFLFYVLTSQRQRALALAEEMTIDVREKNRALKLSEERFALALESSSTGVWSWKFSDNSIQWDDSMFALFGIYGSDQSAGYDAFLNAVHSEDRDRVFKELTSAVEGKQNYDTEYRVVWSDNSIHYVASRAKILYEDGAPVSMIGTCWDVTERKRMDKLKSEFVSTVSHELRTPL